MVKDTNSPRIPATLNGREPKMEESKLPRDWFPLVELTIAVVTLGSLIFPLVLLALGDL